MSTFSPWPHFFVVGAPKSATGSIYALLETHPAVRMGAKDLHFFAPDLASTQARQSEARYLAQFDGAPDSVLRGEASVGYLYSHAAPRAIHGQRPDAAIVMSLRNPLTAIPSLHRHCLYYGIEEIEDLREALAAQADRAAGRRIPARCANPWMLQYTRVYSYSEQVERYFSAFGRERCHVIIYDDFGADAEHEMRRLTDFLGLAPLAIAGAQRVNATRTARSRRVSALLTDPPPLARRLARASTPQWLRRRVADGLLAINTTRAASTNGSDPGQTLAATFADEIERLSLLLHRDLSAWLPSSTPPRRGTARSAAAPG